MRPLSRRSFLVTLTLAGTSGVIRAQGDPDDDVILKAMREELARSRQLRVVGGGGDDLPYFISYTVGDEDSFGITASLGSTLSSTHSRARFPFIEVRVGSADFDNTGHSATGYYAGSRYDEQPWPLDDNYQAIRQALWLATDHAYKAAVESIARKRAAQLNVSAADRLPDYSSTEPIKSLAKVSRRQIDAASWTPRIAKLSGIFNSYPEVETSGIDLHVNLGTTYLVNSEGTEIRYPDNILWLFAKAQGQAPDGMIVRDGLSIQKLEPDQFPNEADLAKALTAMAENVKTQVHAPAGESFTGPVLFEPIAAGQLLAQLLGDNLSIPRKPIGDAGRFVASELEGRIGSRVLPEWMNVTDDPTQTIWQGKPLAGFYPFDLEGVRPKPVSVIEKGVLRSYLTTRQPVKGSQGSNGHARLPGNFGARRATLSNLFVTARESSSMADLKTRMIALLKDRDKPYGMLVRRLDFPFSAGLAEMQALGAASSQSGGSVRPVSPPILIYRVFPDGREELVRGLRFRGISTRSLRDIMAASSETALFEYVANGVPMSILGVGGLLAPVSVISPGLLFEEMELEFPQEPLPKLPLVPPPPVNS